MIPYGRHHIDEDDIAAVVQVLRGGALTQGPSVEAFERAVAEYVGARFAVALSSGTAALHLAALAAGMGPGHTLITSPITFVASSNAALYAGGDIGFADIDPATANMSRAGLEAALVRHPRTKVVVPVHFAGLPCDMASLEPLATAAGAVIVEDAAHALGATYPDGRRVGCCSYSLMTIFSFHPVKAIAAGEGGMITTNDEHVYRHLLRLRSHGINKLDDPLQIRQQALTDGRTNPWYYEMQELGYHYRITDIQCVLALSQLGKLDRFIARRRELARRYDSALGALSHLHPLQAGCREVSGMHIYVAQIDFASIGLARDQFMMALREKGIGSQVHYIPVPMQPYYRRLGCRPEDFPFSLSYYERALSIPLYFDLSFAEQDNVIRTLTELVT